MGALLRPDSAVPRSGWRATAFGLDIDAEFPAVGLDDLGGVSTGRPVSLGLVSPARLEQVWRPDGAETVVSQRQPAMTLDTHPALGYLLATEDFGSYLLSLDGALVRCAPPEVEAWRWQRFLTGHVLPLAALLRGYEVFHASAVDVGGRALAVVGASGAGKSSIAIQLMLGGAGLITDDVLVLWAEDDGLEAHPGAGLVNLRHAEYELLLQGPRPVGPEVGRDAKNVRLRVDRKATAQRLDAMYFLNRWDGGDGVRIERVEVVDPERLLAATYNFVVRTPKRLINQLDVCSRIATEVELFDVRCPPSTDAAALAREIEAHLGGLRRDSRPATKAP